MHPERIRQDDKKLVSGLNYDGIEFPVRENGFSQTEKNKKNTCINVFCYENKLTLPIYVSDQKFENSMDLFLVIDENKSHTCISKILIDLCFAKQRIKTKNTFVKGCFQCFSCKMC